MRRLQRSFFCEIFILNVLCVWLGKWVGSTVLRYLRCYIIISVKIINFLVRELLCECLCYWVNMRAHVCVIWWNLSLVWWRLLKLLRLQELKDRFVHCCSFCYYLMAKEDSEINIFLLSESIIHQQFYLWSSFSISNNSSILNHIGNSYVVFNVLIFQRIPLHLLIW